MLASETSGPDVGCGGMSTSSALSEPAATSPIAILQCTGLVPQCTGLGVRWFGNPQMFPPCATGGPGYMGLTAGPRTGIIWLEFEPAFGCRAGK